jgi:hypothetical protein
MALRIRKLAPQDAVDDAEDGSVQAYADDKGEQRASGEAWAAAQQAEGVTCVANKDVEVLARCAYEHVRNGAKPQAYDGSRSSALHRIVALIAEVVGHRRSKVAAKFGGEEAQERAKQPIVQSGTWHSYPPAGSTISFLVRAARTRSRSRSASASATRRPNAVRRYARRRSVLPCAESRIIPSARSRLMMP